MRNPCSPWVSPECSLKTASRQKAETIIVCTSFFPLMSEITIFCCLLSIPENFYFIYLIQVFYFDFLVTFSGRSSPVSFTLSRWWAQPLLHDLCQPWPQLSLRERARLFLPLPLNLSLLFGDVYLLPGLCKQLDLKYSNQPMKMIGKPGYNEWPVEQTVHPLERKRNEKQENRRGERTKRRKGEEKKITKEEEIWKKKEFYISIN